jgi:hypothetical protein
MFSFLPVRPTYERGLPDIFQLMLAQSSDFSK